MNYDEWLKSQVGVSDDGFKAWLGASGLTEESGEDEIAAYVRAKGLAERFARLEANLLAPGGPHVGIRSIQPTEGAKSRTYRELTVAWKRSTDDAEAPLHQATLSIPRGYVGGVTSVEVGEMTCDIESAADETCSLVIEAEEEEESPLELSANVGLEMSGTIASASVTGATLGFEGVDLSMAGMMINLAVSYADAAAVDSESELDESRAGGADNEIR